MRIYAQATMLSSFFSRTEWRLPQSCFDRGLEHELVQYEPMVASPVATRLHPDASATPFAPSLAA
jgi:hypothetical protein